MTRTASDTQLVHPGTENIKLFGNQDEKNIISLILNFYLSCQFVLTVDKAPF